MLVPYLPSPRQMNCVLPSPLCHLDRATNERAERSRKLQRLRFGPGTATLQHVSEVTPGNECVAYLRDLSAPSLTLGRSR